MVANDPYVLDVARVLLRCGAWDAAVAVLGDGPDAGGMGVGGLGAAVGESRSDAAQLRSDAAHSRSDAAELRSDAAELRAQILVERHFWRLDDPSAAEAAVGALDPQSSPAAMLGAQLAYTRVLFDREPLADDPHTAGAGFRAAARDEALRGWATFWLGVVADQVEHDPATARTRYEEAWDLCRERSDPLLESYVVRHLGGAAIERGDRATGELLLRRSLHLRAALGARPQVAAAQVQLAGELPPGAERDLLLEAARLTAEELGLTWLRGALAEV
jgi:hypothetical protein